MENQNGSQDADVMKYEFTQISEERFYDTVDLKKFKDDEPEVIFEFLKKQMRLIPFGDFLKRYIYERARFLCQFDEVELTEYQELILGSFKDNNAPKSFRETSSKLSALAKNWLTQSSVNREVVFLLGFGLHMTVNDVSEFLTKALRERDFNFRDPFEVICWYCYKNGFQYAKMDQLMREYESVSEAGQALYSADSTLPLKISFSKVKNDEELLGALSRINPKGNKRGFSVTAKKRFDELYLKARAIIAGCFNDDETENVSQRVSQAAARLSRSEQYPDEVKAKMLDEIRSRRKVWTPDMISEADVEKFLCCGVPFDKSGNLLKYSVSELAKHFENKRLSRHHIRDILNTNCSVDRFDLITLNFFILSQDESITNNKVRFLRFVDETDLLLTECSMGRLYMANPYDCFLMMCVLTDYPLGTYADVLELSFESMEN